MIIKPNPKALLFIATFLICGIIQAQTLKGKVIGKLGIGLSDTYLSKLGVSDSAKTNSEGVFSLNAVKGDSISIKNKVLNLDLKFVLPANDSILIQVKENSEIEVGLWRATSGIKDSIAGQTQTVVDTAKKQSALAESSPPQDSTNSVSDTSKNVVGQAVLSPTGDTILIKGKITNAKGEAIQSASIEYPDGKLFQSNKDGSFSIPFIKNIKVTFSSIGSAAKEVLLTDSSQILAIQLQASSDEKMKEVVVTALGIEKDTRTLSYGVQQVAGSKLNETRDPNGNIMNGLNGKVAGLQTTPGAGGPGSATKIVLRGNKSITGSNNALLVIDGVPASNSFGSQPGDENGGYVGSDGSVNVNPDDIESVSVLSGASAAALYGSSAGNGAIIMTTKKGKEGPLKVTYNGGVSVLKPFLQIDYQNKYGRGSGGAYSENSGVSWGAPGKTYKDNVIDFFQNGLTVNNSVSMSGGGESLQGYASYTNNYSSGVFKKNELKRNTINARLTGKFLDKITTDLKVTYVDQQIDNKPRLGEIATALNAYVMPRDVTPAELANYQVYNDSTKSMTPAPWPTPQPSIYINPNWLIYNTAFNEARKRIMIMGSVKYDINDWLNVQARYSLDNINDESQTMYNDGTRVLVSTPGGLYTESRNQSNVQYADLLISGKNDITKDLNINYVLGGSVATSRATGLNTTANGLYLPNLFYLPNGISTASTNSISRSNTQALFATAQFGYKDFLFLDATARTDWTSTLPPPYNFFYPSVGLTGILSDMVKMPEWVSFGKVRGSYAFVGQGGGGDILRQYFTLGPGSGQGFISRDGTLSIPDLKPAQSRSLELGTEWAFLNDRLSINATYYKTNTINQLFTIAIPPATGYSSRYINAGNIANQGIELILGGTPIVKNGFNWNTSIALSVNKNKVVALSEQTKKTKLSGSERLGVIGIREGDAYGDIYGQKWKQDESGQFIVDANGLPVVEQDAKLGNVNPKMLLGWNNTFGYKGISLGFQIDGRIGGSVVSGTDSYLANYGLTNYTTDHRNEAWVLPGVTEDGATNNVAIKGGAEEFWTTVSQGGRAAWTQFFMYDATNVRLREVSLGYTFKFKSDYISSAKLSFVANNLMFFYTGKSLLDIPGVRDRKVPFDPEMSLGAGNSQGLESGISPGVRSYGVNLKLSF